MDTINQRSHNLFIDSGAVDNDDIDQMIDGAYSENLAAGRVVTPEFVDDTAKGALAAQLDEMTPAGEEEIRWPELDGLSPEHIALYEETFAQTHKLFERTGWNVPDPAHFMMEGVDLEAYAGAYDAMQRGGLEPMIVVAPINTHIEEWRQLYWELAHDSTISSNPISHSFGLTIRQADDTLSRMLEKTKTEMHNKLNPLAIVETTTALDAGEIEWAMRIIPQARLGLGLERHSISVNYPTVFEYLTIQGRRIQAGKIPMDVAGTAGTWLEGASSDDERTPYATWDGQQGQVLVVTNIATRGNCYQRTPVWQHLR